MSNKKIIRIACSGLVVFSLAGASAGEAHAFSRWFLIDESHGGNGDHWCDTDSAGNRSCDIRIYWDISDWNKYDRLELCWRLDSRAFRGVDPCQHYSQYFYPWETEYQFQNLLFGRDYKIKLRGRKISRRGTVKWKTLLRNTLENVSFIPRMR